MANIPADFKIYDAHIMLNKNLHNLESNTCEELTALQKQVVKDATLNDEFRAKVYTALTNANLQTKLHEYGFHSVLTPLEKTNLKMYK